MSPASPLVSIVVANYNYARYLGEALESALAQTHRQVEVIVVDDGSTDDSLAVAGRYPVRILAEEHFGVGAARNRGAVAASGVFLMFLDADDRLEPTYVEACLAALQAAPFSVAYAYTAMQSFGLEERLFPSQPFDPKALLQGNYIHASALIRSEVFKAAGGFDPTWALGYEDYELWVRLFADGFHGVLVPEPLLLHRRHGPSRNSLTASDIRKIRWRLRLTFPRFYWWCLLREPSRAIRYAWALKGQYRRWRGPLKP